MKLSDDVFPNRLIELRQNKGLKRQELANDLGISRAGLEYYEKGSRKPNIDILLKLADYYGVTCDYLLGLTDIPTTDKVEFICEATGLDKEDVRCLMKFQTFKKDLSKSIKTLGADCK